MATINKTGYNDTSNTEQWALNNSVDREFNVLATENLVYNADDETLERMSQPTTPTDSQLSELVVSLRNLVTAITNPPYIDKSANAIRNQVQSGTVTTVSTVTNLTNFGTQGADVTYRINSNNAWANNIRRLIT